MMLFKTISLCSAALLIAGGAVLMPQAHTNTQGAYAQDYDAETHNHKAHGHHAGYVKPGAGIALSHDYNGHTGVGYIETVTLTLSHVYDEGYLSFSLLPSPDLRIFSDVSAQKETLSRGSSVTVPVQFSGAQEGSYSLSVEAVYENLEGHQSRRVLSVPIVIGTRPAAKLQTTKPKTAKKSAPSGLVVLPAQEVIR